MSGGSILDLESGPSGRGIGNREKALAHSMKPAKEASGAGKWEDRFHKQVEANNLLSDKLRNLRTKASEMIARLQTAYSLQTTELLKAQVRVAELERENEQNDT